MAGIWVRIWGPWFWSGSGLTSGVPQAPSPLATEAAIVKGDQILVSKSYPALAICTTAEEGPKKPQTTGLKSFTQSIRNQRLTVLGTLMPRDWLWHRPPKAHPGLYMRQQLTPRLSLYLGFDHGGSPFLLLWYPSHSPLCLSSAFASSSVFLFPFLFSSLLVCFPFLESLSDFSLLFLLTFSLSV